MIRTINVVTTKRDGFCPATMNQGIPRIYIFFKQKRRVELFKIFKFRAWWKWYTCVLFRLGHYRYSVPWFGNE